MNSRRSRQPPTALQFVAAQRYGEQARGWVRRYLPAAVLVCLAGYLLGFAAAGWVGGLIGLGAVAGVGVVGWGVLLWRRLTVAVAAALLTVAAVGGIVGRLYQANGLGGEAAVAAGSLWCLTFVGLLGSWRIRRHAGNRALTAIACDAVVVVAAFISGTSINAAIALAIVGVIVVLAVRGGMLLSLQVMRARVRSRLKLRRLSSDGVLDISRLSDEITDDTKLVQGMKRERQVNEALAELDPRIWTLLHSRRLPETGEILEHLLIGPPGIVVCSTAHWQEAVALTDIGGGQVLAQQVYTLNGSSKLLAERLQPILVATRQVAWTLDIHPDELRAVVVFAGDARQLPEPVVEIDLLRLWDDVRECQFDATAYLVSAQALVGFLLALPRRSAARTGRLGGLFWRLRGVDQAIIEQRRDLRYARDVAAICDQLFPPVDRR